MSHVPYMVKIDINRVHKIEMRSVMVFYVVIFICDSPKQKLTPLNRLIQSGTNSNSLNMYTSRLNDFKHNNSKLGCLLKNKLSLQEDIKKLMWDNIEDWDKCKISSMYKVNSADDEESHDDDDEIFGHIFKKRKLNHDELSIYLNEKTISGKTDILAWWKIYK
ncbi:hypothetical protein RhiirC2_802233 [Rhizophagus irregularis]|uniref:Uncharacterized protein n=1 Tax=Rhizophagus irregularis TaxID=588596 RepID=A0A2N1M1K4_9GLOM|nr:hypothetical protein RhiirC2_802233 [Rhizophagus irregularis]